MSTALRPLLTAVVSLVAALLLVAASARAQEPARVPDGVSVASVELGGLTLDEATARLGAELAPRFSAPVVIRAAGRRFVLQAARARVRFDAAATARRALTATHSDVTPQVGGAGGAGIVLLPTVRHARLAVRAFAAQIAARVGREPRNAELILGVRRQRVRRARLGVQVDSRRLAAAIDQVLDDPTAPRFVEQRVKRTRPAVNANDIRAANRTIITVSKRDFTLRLFQDLKLRKSYRVAVGQPIYPTPNGTFRISDKQIDPVWSVPNSPWAGELGGSRVAGGSASNPLKARWMGIVNGVGIHGTGDDWSIGSAASHGCIRMHVWDVKDLYPRVPVGTIVLIR
ncbi:unannotated protein [freshwater metagenome]|uniref:Unannotated protein n=1 Tax=freshwater metagenome TaxID=449393 RepID=A0A6J7E6F6_9ZZZZ|nr:L,D-transpeptidase family protein [Actinomycetota bacterium]